MSGLIAHLPIYKLLTLDVNKNGYQWRLTELIPIINNTIIDIHKIYKQLEYLSIYTIYTIYILIFIHI